MSTPKKLDPKFREMLAKIARDGADADEASAEIVVADQGDLQELYRRFTAPPAKPFVPGMLVRWKPGLSNKRFPAYGEAAVVVEVLDTPCVDPEAEAGLTYFREPLDLVLGVRYKTGDFLLWHYDSRRFEPLP